MQIKMINCTAPVAAKHAAGMGIIDHDNGVIFLGSRHDVWQGRNVTVHTENAVSNNQNAAVLRSLFLQYAFQIIDIAVCVYGTRSFGQPYTINNTGMV